MGTIFMLFAAFKITVDARAAVAAGGERRAGGVRGAGDARASAGHGRDGGGNEMTEGTAMQQRDKGSDAGRDRGSDSGALVHADALTPKNVAGEGRWDDGGDEGGGEDEETMSTSKVSCWIFLFSVPGFGRLGFRDSTVSGKS